MSEYFRPGAADAGAVLDGEAVGGGVVVAVSAGADVGAAEAGVDGAEADVAVPEGPSLGTLVPEVD
ncbi:hypothetical protein [uncultured Arthrobacter sp.]|uniref:hypothetical protein n=1 Tax=uncultured Arthrobacter sp. TaxID=114050 RepID=UPI003217DFE8